MTKLRYLAAFVALLGFSVASSTLAAEPTTNAYKNQNSTMVKSTKVKKHVKKVQGTSQKKLKCIAKVLPDKKSKK